MRAVTSLVVLAAGALLGAGALIAYRLSQETGKPFQESISEVPAELERLYVELKGKGREAYEKGRAASIEKRQDMTDQLGESDAAHS